MRGVMCCTRVMCCTLVRAMQHLTCLKTINQRWERLVALAEKSNGRLIIPTSVPVANGAGSSSIAAVAGANLLTHGPEVCNWLCTVCPGETFTVGAYAYMDGTLFVRVALAMDAIAMGVCKARPDSRVAYLCSPTDCFTAPVSAADQGDATYDRLITAAYASPIRMRARTRRRALRPNIVGAWCSEFS